MLWPTDSPPPSRARRELPGWRRRRTTCPAWRRTGSPCSRAIPRDSWQVLRLPRIPTPVPLYLRTPRKMIIVKEEPRAAVIGRLRTPAGGIVVANTHLSYVPGWGRHQLRRIRRDLAPLHGPVILMGDLNMADGLPARITGYRQLARHFTFPARRARSAARSHLAAWLAGRGHHQ